jgi:hypothetical protein
LRNHERFTATLASSNAARTSAEPIPRRSYSAATASGVRVSTSHRTAASATKSVHAEHDEARNWVADPGDECRARRGARRCADRRDHAGHLWALGERASHDAIDHVVVGVMLGPDNELAHSPTLDRILPNVAIGLSAQHL